MGTRVLSAGVLGVVVGVLGACPGMGQSITLDGSLGPLRALGNGPVYTIRQVDGTTVGTNLFHSFGRFDLATGEVANFQSAAAIRNILARVTGGAPSSIDGLIFTDSSAVNLFLINPSGIVFGPNASLDIGGTTRGDFTATTLDSVVWPDGSRFDAVNPGGAAPLLRIVGDPSGFLASQRQIPGITVDRSRLRVPNTHDLRLLGGNVAMSGGQLDAWGGRVEIGAVAGPGTVGLLGNGGFQLPDGLVQGDVRFTNAAFVDVTLGNGGDIGITGRDIGVFSGSILGAGIARNLGSSTSQAGLLKLDATGTVTVAGTSSRVANEVKTGATGRGGNLEIDTGSLVVRDGAKLGAVTSGTGEAGNVLITASDRVLFQGTNGQFVSAAFSRVEAGGEGKGGNVVIAAPVLEVRDGAQLVVSTRGKGDAGNVQITARDRILFQNGAVFSGVAAGGEGKGGNVVIEAPVLEMRDGAQLVASTSGKGDAGNVQITARDRVLFEGVNRQVSSGAFSSVEAGADGKGGNVVIEAPVLEVRDGARLVASTSGKGDAGNVRITAGDRVLFQSGSALSNVVAGGVGKGGNVVIVAPVLEFRNGAALTARTSGKGDAGNVLISARDRVLFQGSFAVSSVATDGVGKGGNVVIAAPVLEVRDGAALTATTGGTGDAGNVLISARDRVLFQGSFALSRVEAGAEGKGGNVVIEAPVLEVSDGAALVASTLGKGDAGNVRITAGDRVLFQNGNAFSNVEAGGEGKGGNVVIAAPVLEVRDGAQLLANTEGKGDAGNVQITAGDRVLFQNSSVVFSNVEAGGEGKGGNVVIVAPVLEVRDGAQLASATRGKGDAGNVLISSGDRVLFQNGNAFSSVEATGVGKGGNVVIEVPVLEVRDGAQLVASTEGKGDAGNVLITAGDRVLFQGTNTSAASSVGASGEGKGGNLEIKTGSLVVRDGAQLLARTRGKGDAGNVLITAGDRVLFQRSFAVSRVEAGAEGKGGNVVIEAPVLEVSDGAALVASTLGKGDAGNVQITAGDRVLFQGANSAVSSSVEATGVGKGGNVVIEVPVLEVRDGAQLVASTEGKGDAGSVLITAGDRVLFQNSSAAFSNVAAGGEGKGGNVVIAASVLEVRDGAQLVASTEGKGDAGNVLITAGDRVLFQNSSGAFSSVAATGVGKGGNVVIAAPVLEVRDGAQLLANTSGKGDAGNVLITAGDRVLFQGTNTAAASSVGASGEGKGGNLEIKTRSLVVRDGARLSASTEGEGDAGNVQITASDRVLFQNGNAFSSVAATGVGNGGNVVIAAPVLEVRNGAALVASTEGKGDAGNVQITAGARVLFQNSSAAFSSVAAGGDGKGGNVVIEAPVLEVRDGAQLIASTEGKGDAGNVQITAGDRVLFQNGSAITRIESGGQGKGGNVVIEAPVLEVRDGAQLTANTFGKGDAGNVLITAGDRVLFQNSSAAISSVEAGGEGKGGNVVIAVPVLEVRDGAQLIAGTGGKGDAGNVRITAGDHVLFQNGYAFSNVVATGEGNGGNVMISAPVLEVRDGAQLVASTEGKGDAGNVQITAGDRVILDGTNSRDGRSSAIFTSNGFIFNQSSAIGGTGTGGEVLITAPQLQVSNGAVIDARTANDKPGGNITLNLGNFTLLNGGQILSTSDGSGPAGTVRIDATEGIRIAGSDPTYADRIARNRNRVAPITANSGIYVRSTNTGASGNVIIGDLGTTPRILLDGGEIVGDSNAVQGGNISLTLNESLLMRNGSLISATAGRAQGAGDGGNITINSPFVLSVPQENNDIIANAFSGTGGNITINADAILNFTLNDKGKTFEQLRNQPTNDISASSEFGGNGTLNLAGLNVDPSRGSVQLPIVPTDNTDRIDTYCAPKSNTTARTSFVTSGRGGLPSRPGSQANTFNTGDIRDFSPQLAQQSTPNPKPEQPLTEAQLSRTTPDGKTHLLAGRAIITPKPDCPDPTLSPNKSSL